MFNVCYSFSLTDLTEICPYFYVLIEKTEIHILHTMLNLENEVRDLVIIVIQRHYFQFHLPFLLTETMCSTILKCSILAFTNENT